MAYIVNWENLTQKWVFVSQTRPLGNRGLKVKFWSRKLIKSKNVFGDKEGIKKREKQGQRER